MLIYIVITTSLLSLGGAQITPSETFTHSSPMNSNQNFFLYWKFNSTYITFEMQAQTTGWIGMGISPNGGMIGADMYAGWVKDGTATVTDRVGGTTNTFPLLDAEQQATLLGGGEQNGWTWIKFARQLPACESNDLPITTDTLKIIWAFGASDPTGNDLTSSNYHGTINRGVRSLLLLETGRTAPTITGNVEEISFRTDSFAVPSLDTFYACRILEFPQPPSKRHIVRIDPIIQSGNEAYVHHMLIYQCPNTLQDPSNINVTGECFGNNSPSDFGLCRMVVHAWAIGGGVFSFPDDVGYPIGTGQNDPQYVMLQTHYDNPGLLSGITDSSGIQFAYTDALRRYDAGIIQVGEAVNPFAHLIPPGSASFQTLGQCAPQCLDQALTDIGQTEINVFAVMLHSHLLGRKLKLRHIAANQTTEYPYIAEDNAYDFDYQEAKLLNQPVIVRTGETMQMECDYDSTGKQVFTSGGDGTLDEMCLAFVLHYPKLPLTVCDSTPVNILRYFNITGISVPSGNIKSTLDDGVVTSPPELAGRTVGNVLNSVNWNQEQLNSFNQYSKALPQFALCTSSSSSETNAGLVAPPVISNPYVPTRAACLRTTTGDGAGGASMAVGDISLVVWTMIGNLIIVLLF